MDLLKKLTRLFGQPDEGFPEIDGFIDAQAGVWCCGDIPLNLKREIAADIHAESGQTRPFSEGFLRELVPDEQSFEAVKFAVRFFLAFSTRIIGVEAPKRGDALYPWAKALCISPKLSVNAGVQLAFDTKAATVFFVINAGVFVQLAHRLLAMFADDHFLQDMAKAPIRSIGTTIQKDPHDQAWCTLKSGNSNLQLVASWTTALAAMVVLNHELAHFYRGHLGFLRKRGDRPGLREIEDKPATGSDQEENVRRRLELDADETGGNLYGVLMREFDHPVPGPDDGKNERFLVLTMLAAASTFIVFEETLHSRRYYPPAWRVHHFFEGFIHAFFSQPMSTEDRNECTDMMLTVISHVEARYADLGWGDGFDFGAATACDAEFFNDDLPGRARLAKSFETFMPHVWPKVRKHNR